MPGLKALRRLTLWLSVIGLVAMLGGCWPGQFPLPKDRSKPPKPSKTGSNSGSSYTHGGLVSPNQFDASGG